MATGVKHYTTKVVEQVVPNGVTLHLSHEEARVLRLILGRVGGCPRTTLRGYANSIGEGLKMGGYEFSYCDSLEAAQGSITFNTNMLLGMEPTETAPETEEDYF